MPKVSIDWNTGDNSDDNGENFLFDPIVHQLEETKRQDSAIKRNESLSKANKIAATTFALTTLLAADNNIPPSLPLPPKQITGINIESIYTIDPNLYSNEVDISKQSTFTNTIYLLNLPSMWTENYRIPENTGTSTPASKQIIENDINPKTGDLYWQPESVRLISVGDTPDIQDLDRQDREAGFVLTLPQENMTIEVLGEKLVIFWSPTLDNGLTIPNLSLGFKVKKNEEIEGVFKTIFNSDLMILPEALLLSKDIAKMKISDHYLLNIITRPSLEASLVYDWENPALRDLIKQSFSDTEGIDFFSRPEFVHLPPDGIDDKKTHKILDEYATKEETRKIYVNELVLQGNYIKIGNEMFPSASLPDDLIAELKELSAEIKEGYQYELNYSFNSRFIVASYVSQSGKSDNSTSPNRAVYKLFSSRAIKRGKYQITKSR